MSTSGACVVCLEDIDSNSTILTNIISSTACNHWLHLQCGLRYYIVHCDSNTQCRPCPYCRSDSNTLIITTTMNDTLVKTESIDVKDNPHNWYITMPTELDIESIIAKSLVEREDCYNFWDDEYGFYEP